MAFTTSHDRLVLKHCPDATTGVLCRTTTMPRLSVWSPSWYRCIFVYTTVRLCGLLVLRHGAGRRLRILAKIEEACSIFGPFRVLTARWSEKNKYITQLVHALGVTSIFGLFPCLTKIQDYTKRDGNFKSRPISLGPNLSTFLES